MMAHVDLCSGIGGFALGFKWAELSKPVLFCDIEPWSRQILRKHWPDVPIAEDVKELANDPDGLIPDCDILTAGYPCQPFSLAGERRGTEDDRHIWPYILSIVQTKRPSWCVFENVYGHVSMGLDEVLSDLEREGYAARPFIVPACATDAPHRRDRVWIIARNVGDTISSRQPGNHGRRSRQVSQDGCEDVADTQSLHSNGSGEHTQQGQRQEPQLGDSRGSDDVAHANSAGLQGRQKAGDVKGSRQRCQKQFARRSEIGILAHSGSQRQQGQRSQGDASNQETDGEGQAAQFINGGFGNFWLSEPAVGRVAHGIPRRVDRLKGLGNAIVPQIAQRIGQTIKQVEALA